MFDCLATTYSPRGHPQVPSALEGLTSVFGMGTGGSPGHQTKMLWTHPENEDGRSNATVRSSRESPRPIRIRQLNTLLCLHPGPIYLVIYKGSYFHEGNGKSHLEGGFALRCFQRLSLPHLATQRCSWRNNWYTRGASIPVLSY